MSVLPRENPHDRPAWMGLLARACPELLARLLPDLPAHEVIRAPQIGTVMTRGRMGGTGAAFNLGEITVTRCTVQLEGGAVGHAYVQGREKDHARRAAVADAMLQGEGAAQIARDVLAPLEDAENAARAKTARRAAATRVDFFTMMRGEDE
ncbi:MAG: phosphonate C-P lyase system protein PhnG [Paracoccus sp. (in: a-proteobacteria)]|nr:phosphonate C-P lyase system protein PhnG [Paracoccus sp. (in: a-proteobacteria)]